MPEGFEWPEWNGAPLQFLCQLDLNDIQEALQVSWLPKEGLLSFFYDEEQSTWGFDPADKGSWRVFRFDSGSATELAPKGLAASVLPEVFLRFEQHVSLPHPERIGLHFDEISDDAWDYLDQHEFDGTTLHQIGGFPSPIQGDNMELECQLASNGVYVGTPEGYHTNSAKLLASGQSEWRLLLQIDTDDDAGMMWGDVGRLYFWVRESDVVHGDFSNVWMILQCS